MKGGALPAPYRGIAPEDMDERDESRAGRARWSRRPARLLVAVAAAVSLAATACSSSKERDAAPTRVPSSVGSDRAGLVVGSGPVTVELYLDFLCPACRAFEADAGDELASLVAANKITLVYRPVAILDHASTNEYSTRSAASAACASDLGKLIPYANLLFQNQPAEGGPGFSDEELIELAQRVQMTEPAFRQCVREHRFVPWVGTVTATMRPKNVLGTPTVFVGGAQLDQPTGERLAAAVAAR